MVQTVLTWKTMIHRLKSMLFYQFVTAIDQSGINIIFEWYLLRIMVFLVWGRDAEIIVKRKKADRRKTFKIKEKEKRRITGKSNNNNNHLWL